MRRIELLSGVTVLALEFLSAVPAICAIEPLEVDANTTGIGQSFVLDQGARNVQVSITPVIPKLIKGVLFQ